MKVEKIREKDGKLELLVELSPAETAEDLQRIAVQEIQKHEWDYGERSELSPVEFVQQMLGNVESAFIFDEGIMRRRAPFALTASKVDAIGSPVYRCAEHAEEGKPFKYQMVCVPVPEYELSDYGPVSITVPAYAVKDVEIEEELQRMVKTATVSITDESHDTVVKGDKVELSLETTMNGKKVGPLTFESREYTTGSFAMPDDFDENIIGMKVGETKTFTYEGPEKERDADGNFIMNEYESTATITRIVESKEAQIDDDWAKSVAPNINSLDDLRADVRKRLEEKHEQDYQRSAETLAGNELAKRLDAEIPDLVYGVAVKEAREGIDNNLREQNLTLDQYLAKENMTQDQLNQALLMQVRQQLTRQFALNAFARHNNLSVNENDLDLFFESIAPGRANLAHQDFNRDGRMYAARCAALRLKAARLAVEQGDVKRIGENEQAEDAE